MIHNDLALDGACPRQPASARFVTVAGTINNRRRRQPYRQTFPQTFPPVSFQKRAPVCNLWTAAATLVFPRSCEATAPAGVDALLLGEDVGDAGEVDRQSVVPASDPPGAHIVKYGARREAPAIMPWVCAVRRDWTLAGSYAMGRCSRCGTCAGGCGLHHD